MSIFRLFRSRHQLLMRHARRSLNFSGAGGCSRSARDTQSLDNMKKRHVRRSFFCRSFLHTSHTSPSSFLCSIVRIKSIIFHIVNILIPVEYRREYPQQRFLRNFNKTFTLRIRKWSERTSCLFNLIR